MFKAMSFNYRYIEEGNSSSSLITEFKSVKDYPRPIILHIRTTKGFGQKVATHYSQSNINFINYGIRNGFYDRYNPDELLRDNNMNIDQILQDI